MGESQDLGQCANDCDLAVAAPPTRQALDSIDKRTDGFENLRSCYLMLQR